MTEKELRKLSRKDLLELLIAQSQQNEQLRKALDDANAELQKRSLIIDQAGSIAEASMQLSGVFEAAETAARQYLEGVKLYGLRQKEEADRLLRESEKRAAEILSNAQRQTEEQAVGEETK